MTAAFIIQFAATLLLVGALFRFVEIKWPDSALGRSLAVIY